MSREHSLSVFQRSALRLCDSRPSVVSLSFGEAIDPERWKAAWTAVQQRHPILRSCFTDSTSGTLALQENVELNPEWEEHDWSALPAEELGKNWSEWSNKEHSLPIELQASQPWRLNLFHLPGGSHHLVFSYSTALLDFDSVFLMLRDWFQFYQSSDSTIDVEATADACSAALEAVAIEEEPLAFWKQFSNGNEIKNPLRFLAEPQDTSAARGVVRKEFLRDDADKLNALAREQDTQLSAILSAAWTLLLARLNAENIAVGHWLANARRLLPEKHREVCGVFENALPVIAQDSAAMEAPAWIARMVDRMWSAEGAILTDPEELAELPAGKRGLSRLDHLFIHRQESLTDRLHTALPRWINADAQLSESYSCPLVLRSVGKKGLELSIDYDAARYRETDMLDLLGLYKNILLQLSEGAKTIDLVPTQEDFPAAKPDLLSDALEHAISRYASSPAAVYGEDIMSFSDIDALSNQLLRHLKKSATPEAALGICLTTTPLLVVVLLAAIKGGRTIYVADDLISPDRAKQFFGAAECTCVLIDAGTEASFDPANTEIKTLQVDKIWDKISQLSDSTLQSRDAKSPARFIFEAPDKNIELDEATLTAAATSLVQRKLLQEEDRLLITSAPGPGLIEKIAASLLAGGTLVFPEGDVWATRSAFQEALQAGCVSHLHIPGSWWVQWLHFLKDLNQQIPDCVRSVWVDGDFYLPKKALEAWQELAGDRISLRSVWAPQRLNAFGFERTNEELFSDSERPGLIAPGRTHAPVRSMAADERGRELPRGFAGELSLETTIFKPTEAQNDLFKPQDRTPETRRFKTGKRGFAGTRQASYFLVEPSEQLTREETARLRAAFENHPSVFEVYFHVATDASMPTLDCWIMPAGAHSSLPKDFKSFVKSVLQRDEDFDVRAATIARLPLDKYGNVQRDLLPATLPLHEDTPPPAKAERATPNTPATTKPEVDSNDSAKPTPSSTLDIVQAVPGEEPTKGALLVFCEEGIGRDLTDELRADLEKDMTLGFAQINPHSELPGTLAAEVIAFAKEAPLHVIAVGAAAEKSFDLLHSLPQSPDQPGLLTLIAPELHDPNTRTAPTKAQGLKKLFGFFKKSQELAIDSRIQEIQILYANPATVFLEEEAPDFWSALLPKMKVIKTDLSEDKALCRQILAHLFSNNPE